MIETKLDGKSKDIIESNIEKLKQIFPEIVTEDKIDFEKLQTILGEEIEESPERYEFTWQGKQEAIKESQIQSTGTLRPCKEESKNWDTTKNLYIEGDNLEVLKLMQKSYYEKVKMIYIDPPYNTGNDFVYQDDFKDNLKNYLELTRQISEENNKKITTNSETEGRYHSNWLNMMYPRLVLARNLLKKDGVIFLSIDSNEITNLKKICDEIFGTNNYICQIPIIKNLKGNNDQFAFAGTHDYCLVYSKSYSKFKPNEFDITEENEIKKWDKDEYGYYKKGANLKATGVDAPREKRPNLFFPIYIKDENISLSKKDGYETVLPLTDGKEMRWRWSKDKFLKEINNIIIIKNDSNVSLYKKQRPSLNELPTKKPKSHFYKPEYSSGTGTSEQKELFNNQKYFSNPKPVSLIYDFIQIGMDKTNEIIMDFFAGSSTTAHALLCFNEEKKANNKFIMVQIPELCDEKSEAYKAGYTNICEISKERIRRAGDKIVEESSNQDLDIGFKVFKLDSSNKLEWDPDYDNLESSLDKMLYNIKEGRSELDLVYEVMLKYGLDLSLPIESIGNIYNIGFGALILCFKDKVNVADGKDIINIIENNNPATCRVVFKDNSFETDADKANLKELLSFNNVDEFITI